MSRCLNLQISLEKAFRGSKHLLTRYLEDFGCLGHIARENQRLEDESSFWDGLLAGAMLASGRVIVGGF